MEETGGKERKGESVGGPVRSYGQWRIIQGYWTLLVGSKPVLSHCLPPNWSQQFSFTAVFIYCGGVYERGGDCLTGDDHKCSVCVLECMTDSD